MVAFVKTNVRQHPQVAQYRKRIRQPPPPPSHQNCYSQELAMFLTVPDSAIQSKRKRWGGGSQCPYMCSDQWNLECAVPLRLACHSNHQHHIALVTGKRLLLNLQRPLQLDWVATQWGTGINSMFASSAMAALLPSREFPSDGQQKKMPRQWTVHHKRQDMGTFFHNWSNPFTSQQEQLWMSKLQTYQGSDQLDNTLKLQFYKVAARLQ